MKESKTILSRYIAYAILLQAIFVTLIALPHLDPYRIQLAEITQLPTDVFWIPLAVLMVFLNFIILKRIGIYLVEPVEELVNQTKLGTKSIAFQKKSMNFEEDHLKHFIESQSLRSADLEHEITRMEAEVERVNELAGMSPEEIDALNAKLKAAAETNEAISSKLITEQSKNTSLEKDLRLLQRELKMRSRELENTQNEMTRMQAEPEPSTTEASSPLASLLAQKLKTPLSLINNLSWRLSKSWEETSPTQVREGLDEICKHSEEQLELLKKYQTEGGKPAVEEEEPSTL